VLRKQICHILRAALAHGLKELGGQGHSNVRHCQPTTSGPVKNLKEMGHSGGAVAKCKALRFRRDFQEIWA
jgi:hypothetical protein